jgi:hypothetical protein
MTEKIPYGRQDINQDDIDAVVQVLRSDYLTQGPMVPAFENAVSSYCGAKHAIAVNSATSALHIACLALGVGKGDVVWTTPITFVASTNCALYCGATVDFVDIDPQTYNMNVEQLAEKLAEAKKNSTLPKVVILVIWQACMRLANNIILKLLKMHRMQSGHVTKLNLSEIVAIATSLYLAFIPSKSSRQERVVWHLQMRLNWLKK